MFIKRKRVALSAIALASGAVLGPSHSAVAQTSELEHQASGYCIDDPDNSTTNGTRIQLYQCLGNANQNIYQYCQMISCELYFANGMCIDDPGNSSTNGTVLQIWSCNGDNAQSWAAVRENGYYVWGNDNGKCIDDANDSNTNGNTIQIWSCNSDNAQQWQW